MRAVSVIRALGPIDAKSVGRDSLLRWMVLFPVLFALLVRWGVPPLTVWLAERFRFDLAPYYPLIVSIIVMTIPMLFGTVIGFLLLDQRDDQTLMALQVTPLTANGYLVYRIGVPAVLSVAMTLMAFPLMDLVEVGFGGRLMAAVGAAPLAPAYALFLAGFAQNKVQGFALMKGAGGLSWPPIVAYFIHSKWQWAFGLCPTYWPAKLYWEIDAGSGRSWLYLVVGLVLQSVLVAALLRRFNTVMHR